MQRFQKLFTPEYSERVLATDPSAYWMLDEAAGPTAWDVSRNERHGAYAGAGVTYYQAGVGDGRTGVLFNGVAGYANMFSASLQAAFSPTAGSLILWARVSGAGVWIDGVTHVLAHFGADIGNNFIRVDKAAAPNNRLYLYYRAGGVLETITIAGVTTTDWMCLALTWNKTADEVRGFLDGVQQGATEVGLGVWVGNLAATLCCLGARSTTPDFPLSGYEAHAALWGVTLTPAQVADLAIVE